jgi:hypothetical protein
MSNPTDPVAAGAQTAGSDKIVIVPAQSSEPSVLPQNGNVETATAESTVASPTAAAVGTSADAINPVPGASGAEQELKAPVKTPFTAALPISQPGECAPLTADQEAKYAYLLSTVSTWTTVPTTFAKNAPMDAIAEKERMWLTRECLLRYLRAVKWNTVEAEKRLLGTLTWRREYGADAIAPDYISPENETGKQVILGYDNASRPCLYLNPSKQNTQRSPRQIQHLVFMLDRVIDLMLPGQETLSLLVNFAESSANGPSVSQGRQVLSILQTHYPERLGRALVINGEFASCTLRCPLLNYMI